MTAPVRLTELGRAIVDPPSVTGLPAASAMSGLERRTVGWLDVLAQSVAAVAPSAASATVPALIAAQAGGGTMISLVIAWLLAACVGSTISQFTRRMAAPGSLYTFATKGLGPATGLATAFALVVGYGFVSMFGLVGAAVYLQTFLGAFAGAWAASTWMTAAGVAGFGAIAFVVLRRGIRLSSRVTLVIELASIAVIVVLLIVVLSRLSPSALLVPFTARMPDLGHLVAGAALALTAFVGFESASSLGREARRPFAVIPRTMRWTVVAVGILYLLSSYTQLAGTDAFGLSFGSGGSVVNALADDSHLAVVGTVLDLGLAASFVACAIASLTALSRVVFSLGREGVLPRVVGTADPQRKTPIAALAIVVPVTMAVPLLLLAAGLTPWQTLSTLLVVSAAGYIVAYILVSAAAPAFLRRIGESTGRAVAVAVISAVALTAVLAVYLIVSARSEPIAVCLVGVVVLLGAAGYGVLATVRRRAIARLGLFDQTTSGDVLGAPATGAVPVVDGPAGRP